ncbi:3,4-dihydroxy-2-butanone-4-phosphate synthase [Nocardia sp. R6R-6]|uniref:3,4-dihydroxy-2-butanone-4-phosphate synthase n=1 Tax=Nocardia sp. R6R-6 TaxID=3459303 RepID=UPI00403E0451
MTGQPRVEEVLRDLAQGRMVVLCGSSPGEAVLTLAAEFATTASLAFIIRHTSGFVSVAVREADCVRLQLPPMWPLTDSGTVGGFTVTVDAASGISTGISAADRARTIRALADPRSRACDFTRPGHVAPIRARRGGIAQNPGPVEAVVELLTRAGVRPIGAMAELVSELVPTSTAGAREGAEFAATHGLSFVSVDDVVEYCLIRDASPPAQLSMT